MTGMNITMETLIMILPLIALQLGLALYCIVKIVREGVSNLNKPLWIVISLFVNLIGPITFLIVGRKKDHQ
ncbi:MAG: PLDc_N domain-containing protein [Ruminococcaceae bacterium]|jgi:ABC-type methionine transport system permease subunit|nr:PLDc_N domain-containing protein [Oscillospiraceae bacterium]